MSSRSIYLGFDKREGAAYAVARYSMQRWMTQPIPTVGLVQSDLRAQNMYWRIEEMRPDQHGTSMQRYDVISDAPVSTEFALTRFLVPYLAQTGWALFADCDVMCRQGANIVRLFDIAEKQSDKALLCVQHDYTPHQSVKMDGQQQTAYRRKNWSSVMMFNCDHPANKSLTLDLVNHAKGRALHQFCWLADSDIGNLPPEWNYLVGEGSTVADPKMVHWTNGGPWMSGFEHTEYAQEWFDMQDSWAL